MYHLASELIISDVIFRARSHPQEVSWRDPRNGGTALHHFCRFHFSVDVVRALLSVEDKVASIQDKFGNTPLHIACWNGNSSEIIELLVRAHRDAAKLPDHRGRRPLHVACSSCPTPTVDTLSLLLQADPDALTAPDVYGHTPLALLCQKYETRLQLALTGELTEDEVCQGVLGQFWTQLRILLEANWKRRFPGDEPDWRFLHSLTHFPGCPRILVELAIKMHPDQVRERIYGYLPLHLAAACPDNSIMKNDDRYCITKLLTLFPEAAQRKDGSGRLPLHLAIESGKSWESALKILFDAFPFAVMEIDERHALFPFMLAAAKNRDGSSEFRDCQLTTIFELLAASPNLVLQPQ